MTEEILALPALVDDINREHDLCVSAVKSGLEHAIRCGELLIRAKEQCEHGEWSEWVADNCSFALRTAQQYMTLYHRSPALLANAHDDALLTINRAMRAIREPKPAMQATPDDRPRPHIGRIAELLEQAHDAATEDDLDTARQAISTARSMVARKMNLAPGGVQLLAQVVHVQKQLKDKRITGNEACEAIEHLETVADHIIEHGEPPRVIGKVVERGDYFGIPVPHPLATVVLPLNAAAALKVLAQVLPEKELQELGRLIMQRAPVETPKPDDIPSKSVLFASEAINHLSRIRKNDPQRRRGLEMVEDWIESNSEAVA